MSVKRYCHHTMVKKTFNQGDVVWLTLDPVLGHEQKGRRPALILTKEEYERATDCHVVCPITTKRKGYVTEVLCNLEGNNAVILSDQIRNVDFRHRKAEYIATISLETLGEVQSKIRTLLFM